MFAVVRFLIDDSVEVVPTNWINGDTCLWPNMYRASRSIKAVKHREMPDHNFKKHTVSVLCTEGTYDRARAKLKKAEETDDIQTSTDQDKGRGKRKRVAMDLSSSDSDSELSLPGILQSPFTDHRSGW